MGAVARGGTVESGWGFLLLCWLPEGGRDLLEQV